MVFAPIVTAELQLTVTVLKVAAPLKLNPELPPLLTVTLLYANPPLTNVCPPDVVITIADVLALSVRLELANQIFPKTPLVRVNVELPIVRVLALDPLL